MLKTSKNKLLNYSRLGAFLGISVTVTATSLATLTFPVLAEVDMVPTSYLNDYRVCAARLLKLGVRAEDTSKSCASVLRPREFSVCINQIQKKTQLKAEDTLIPCRQARRPEEFAACVVSISAKEQEAIAPTALSYCGRSLLPVRFAQCVVGVRSETDFASVQAMDTCIDASDKLGDLLPITPPRVIAPPTNPGNPPK
ncbi:hypothetical protein [Calothrix sp. PCC 6303]|uniref:hypothetical protein n=1 Tax=Calothrix sp. PCC 6303 TaxID=1170562 RepID=UPI0002A03332|nr:hypothetical protein [Calothrix sp. PCC 6303]AFZ00539.1 hypothetical protein Cal6303_1491 [Calothrix sp. PCC 6303]